MNFSSLFCSNMYTPMLASSSIDNVKHMGLKVQILVTKTWINTFMVFWPKNWTLELIFNYCYNHNLGAWPTLDMDNKKSFPRWKMFIASGIMLNKKPKLEVNARKWKHVSHMKCKYVKVKGRHS
jgi:hypothetical protein